MSDYKLPAGSIHDGESGAFAPIPHDNLTVLGWVFGDIGPGDSSGMQEEPAFHLRTRAADGELDWLPITDVPPVETIYTPRGVRFNFLDPSEHPARPYTVALAKERS